MKKRHFSSILIFSLVTMVACNQSSFVAENSMCDYSGQLTSDQIQELKNYAENITMKIEPKSGDTIATLNTDLGDIKVLLYTNEAPTTTENFIELANQQKYENVAIHRVIDCFMVQTGDFENGNGTGGYSHKGPGTTIRDEFGPGLKHLRGAVSMAKTDMPDTAGSQFFIVQADYGTPWLDGMHAVFGYVYEGMEIVDRIAKMDTDGNDRPMTDIAIKSVQISIK